MDVGGIKTEKWEYEEEYEEVDVDAVGNPMQCFNCQGWGHAARNCPSAKGSKGKGKGDYGKGDYNEGGAKAKGKGDHGKGDYGKGELARAAKHLARATKALASSAERSDTSIGSAAVDDRSGPTASEKSSTEKQRKPSGLEA